MWRQRVEDLGCGEAPDHDDQPKFPRAEDLFTSITFVADEQSVNFCGRGRCAAKLGFFLTL